MDKTLLGCASKHGAPGKAAYDFSAAVQGGKASICTKNKCGIVPHLD